MGKLITIIGNSGVGKTTLVNALQDMGDYFVGLEEHDTRPFHDLCLADPERYGLANQLDFLILRAEQEQTIRQQTRPGLIDGGLDMDYWGFAHLFHHKGILSSAEFALCQRFYRWARTVTSLPDLFIFLDAPLDIVAQRHAARARPGELTHIDDLIQLDRFIRRWLTNTAVSRLITLDASTDHYLRPAPLQTLHHTIQRHLT